MAFQPEWSTSRPSSSSGCRSPSFQDPGLELGTDEHLQEARGPRLAGPHLWPMPKAVVAEGQMLSPTAGGLLAGPPNLASRRRGALCCIAACSSPTQTQQGLYTPESGCSHLLPTPQGIKCYLQGNRGNGAVTPNLYKSQCLVLDFSQQVLSATGPDPQHSNCKALKWQEQHL